MSKQIKIQTPSEPVFPRQPLSSTQKVQSLKQRFITFQSFYDYGENYEPLVHKILIKNPKWCNLSLRLGHTGEYLKLWRLRRTKSLRLRSVHLHSYYLDSQTCGDRINRYFGELDAFMRAGHTLKRLALSVIHSDEEPTYFLVQERKPDTYHRLKKFVKKQKHLDEFGIYMGSQGDSKWMSGLLQYVTRTVKTLTIENLAIQHIFKKYGFPKLESLRFEYMYFLEGEEAFDFSILKRSLQDILALSSLKSLVFSQYQRYFFEDIAWIDEQNLRLKQFRLNSEFWEGLRAELDKCQGKPCKIKYHKMEDEDIPEKVENFKRIFQGLPRTQTFEYEVAFTSSLPQQEIKAQELKAQSKPWGFPKDINYHTGTRYLISLGKVESI